MGDLAGVVVRGTGVFVGLGVAVGGKGVAVGAGVGVFVGRKVAVGGAAVTVNVGDGDGVDVGRTSVSVGHGVAVGTGIGGSDVGDTVMVDTLVDVAVGVFLAGTVKDAVGLMLRVAVGRVNVGQGGQGLTKAITTTTTQNNRQHNPPIKTVAPQASQVHLERSQSPNPTAAVDKGAA